MMKISLNSFNLHVAVFVIAPLNLKNSQFNVYIFQIFAWIFLQIPLNQDQCLNPCNFYLYFLKKKK
jgi:hypothetical protein